MDGALMMIYKEALPFIEDFLESLGLYQKSATSIDISGV